MTSDTIITGDALVELRRLHNDCIDCVVTSPPYWSLRDYAIDGQIGLEDSLEAYLERLFEIFAEVKRVLKDTGTCWVNLGDTYASGGGRGVGQLIGGSRAQHRYPDSAPKSRLRRVRPKCLLQVPYRFSIGMVDRLGWTLRNVVVWHKPNPLPESVKDRLSTTWEPLFFFTKSERYYFNLDAIRVPHKTGPARFNYRVREAKTGNRGKVVGVHTRPEESARYNLKGEPLSGEPSTTGKNPGDLWEISPQSSRGVRLVSAYPERLVEIPILAGCPPAGIVLDPFIGSGTTAIVARRLGCHYIGIELNPETAQIARRRIATKGTFLDFEGERRE